MAVSVLGQPPVLVSNILSYQALRQSWGQDKVVLVPTMGALHDGHLALMNMARGHGDRVVVSIFVNPLQFGPNEDFQRYPRTLEADLLACQSVGVDCVYAPDVAELYPTGMDNASKIIPPAELTEQLCGLDRPGHFTGVATVVAKLFGLLKPDVAIFGEKDAQQLAIIERMVSDFAMPVHIVRHPIIRDTSGLAMSSRNRYLQTVQERQAALILNETLRQVVPGSSVSTLQTLLATVLAEKPVDVAQLFALEYLEARDAQLKPVQVIQSGTRIWMAAKITLAAEGQAGPKTVRLIDTQVVQ